MDKYYTIKEIANACNTYKKKIERYLKANNIEPDYVDGAHYTKYYNKHVYEQALIMLSSDKKVLQDTTNGLKETQGLYEREINELSNQLRENSKQLTRALDMLKEERDHSKELELRIHDLEKDLEKNKTHETGAIQAKLDSFIDEANKNIANYQKSLESTKKAEIEHVKHIQELENTINELKEENRNLKQQTRHEPKKRWFQFWK